MSYWRPGYATNGQYYGPGGGYYGGYGGYGPGGIGYGGTNDGDGGFKALSQFGGFDLKLARRVRFAHGVLACLAFVVFFPVGAISIRIIPGRFALFVHALFQICGYILYTIAFGMGCWLIREVRYGNFDLVSLLCARSTIDPNSFPGQQQASHNWYSCLPFSLIPANYRCIAPPGL
jgi:hypothetical protein